MNESSTQRKVNDSKYRSDGVTIWQMWAVKDGLVRLICSTRVEVNYCSGFHETQFSFDGFYILTLFTKTFRWKILAFLHFPVQHGTKVVGTRRDEYLVCRNLFILHDKGNVFGMMGCEKVQDVTTDLAGGGIVLPRRCSPAKDQRRRLILGRSRGSEVTRRSTKHVSVSDNVVRELESRAE